MNILIYRLGSLGDTVMALPCFHKIREVFPDSDITLLTNRPVNAKAASVASVLGNYFFTRKVDYPVGTRNPFILAKLLWKIRKLKIDLLVNLTAVRSKRSSLRDKWFFRIAGIRKLVGFPEKDEDFKISIDPQTGEYEWEAKRLTKRMRALGNIDLGRDHYWDLKLAEEEKNVAKKLLNIVKGYPLISIAPGTKMQSKDWGKDNWLKVLKLVSADLDGSWALVVLGAEDEEHVGQACCQVWKGPSLNLCGRATIRESGAVLAGCKLFVGPDSGPMHLAAALDVPCVAVFSARNLPRQWYPRGQNNQILYHRTDCAGCGLETCIEQQKKCILSISLEEVKTAVFRLLEFKTG